MPVLVAGGRSRLLQSGTQLWAQTPGNSSAPISATSIRGYVDPSAIQVFDYSLTTVTDFGGNHFRIEKSSGTSNWDGAARSDYALTGDFAFGVQRFNTVNSFFFAATSSPAATTDYAFDYAFAWDNGSGAWQVWVASSYAGFSGTDSGGSLLAWIWRSGTTLSFGIGATLAAAQASPLHTIAGVTATLYFDTSIYDVGTSFDVYLTTDFPALAYNLTASTGSYALSGTVTVLRAARTLALTPGAYALTGTPTALRVARRQVEAVGTYALTGTPTALRAARVLVGTVGSYAVTGTPSALRVARKLAEVVGAYAVTGTTTGLRAARRLAGAVGSYVISGSATGLVATRKLDGVVGSYTLTGTPVGLKAERGLTAAPGAYVLTGTAVVLRAARRFSLQPGSYVLDGQTVELFYHAAVPVVPRRIVVRGHDEGSAGTRSYAFGSSRSLAASAARSSRGCSSRSYSSSRGR